MIYDELAAPKPSDYTWLLNTFEAAEIDAASRALTVRQRETRLRVQHLLPRELEITQSNERTEPLSQRYTEKFPQQWNIRVKTARKSDEQRFLTLLHVCRRHGRRGKSARDHRHRAVGGLTSRTAQESIVLFQRSLAQPITGTAEHSDRRARHPHAKRAPDTLARTRRHSCHGRRHPAVPGGYPRDLSVNEQRRRAAFW